MRKPLDYLVQGFLVAVRLLLAPICPAYPLGHKGYGMPGCQLYQLSSFLPRLGKDLLRLGSGHKALPSAARWP